MSHLLNQMKRYVHTSGCDAYAEFTFTSEGNYVDLHPVADPRPFEGQPFTVKREQITVYERRDPNGPYDESNAVEVVVDGRYYAEPLRISRRQFDAEWMPA